MSNVDCRSVQVSNKVFRPKHKRQFKCESAGSSRLLQRKVKDLPFILTIHVKVNT